MSLGVYLEARGYDFSLRGLTAADTILSELLYSRLLEAETRRDSAFETMS